MGNPVTGCPSVITSANPLTAVIVPKVTIKGCARNRFIITALAKPIEPEIHNVKNIESATPKSALRNSPTRMEESTSTEPMERSMPPEIITIVIPRAIIASWMKPIAITSIL